VFSDASKHASPNAGWSEAAAAWALNLRLGGTNFYDGVPHSGPIFNPNAPAPQPNDILRVLRWFWGVAFLCVALLASGIALRVHSIPKPQPLPPVPADVPMPVLKTDFTTQPAPPPVKLKGEISYERKSKP
jgi:hypothetical protein